MAQFIANITGKPRYDPHVQWDKRIWVANIFRAWEYLAGRRYGIRAEASSQVEEIDGVLHVKYEFYTIEALLAYLEATLRGYFKLFFSFFTHPQPNLDYKPVYATFGILGLILSFHTSIRFLPLFGLAIALDVSNNSGDKTASPFTWSHTNTGSNLLLVICTGLFDSGVTPVSSNVTYNSVTATVAKRIACNTTDGEGAIWLLGNPATGANTISVTASGASGFQDYGGIAISYSGAQSGSVADATASGTGSGTGVKSINLTTVTKNCWIVNVIINDHNTITASQTSRGTVSLATNNSAIMGAEDTNGVVNAGSTTTMGYNIGGSGTPNVGQAAVSFAPFALPSFKPNNLRPRAFAPGLAR